MNIKIVKLLAAICAAFIVVILLEWIVASYSQSRLLASIGLSKPQNPQSDGVPSIDLKGKTEESYADLVARPLFIKGRRPVDEPSPEQADGQPGSDVFDWQLSGVYTSKKGMSALFSRAKTPVAKDNFRKLKENDDLDGWKLTEIHNDKVMLKQGNEPKELLLRKPKPKELPQTQNDLKNPASAQDRAQRRSRPNRPPVPQSSENSDSEYHPPVTNQPSEEDAPENSDNE
jgi:hypothetical protein